MGIKDLLDKISHWCSKLSVGDVVAYDGDLPIFRVSDSFQPQERIAIIAYSLGKGYDMVFVSKEEGRRIARESYKRVEGT